MTFTSSTAGGNRSAGLWGSAISANAHSRAAPVASDTAADAATDAGLAAKVGAFWRRDQQPVEIVQPDRSPAGPLLTAAALVLLLISAVLLLISVDGTLKVTLQACTHRFSRGAAAYDVTTSRETQ